MSLHAVKPKILGFINEGSSAWGVACAAFAAGITLTVILAFGTQRLYDGQVEQRFELLATERFSRIEERFLDQVQRLDSLRRFFFFASDVGRSEFEGYARPLLSRTQAYIWAPLVKDNDREFFERHQRALSGGDFTLRELRSNGQLAPAGRRSEYMPVLYSQSSAPISSLIGFDLLSDPARQATLRSASLRGSIAISAPLRLLSAEPGREHGVLMVAPVPSRGEPMAGVAGFVAAAISLQQLMADGLPVHADDNLSVRIFDVTGGTEQVLFESSDEDSESSLGAARELSIADRSYRVEIQPSHVFMKANRSAAMGVVILLGGLLSVLLSALLYVQVNQRQRALKLVEQRTAQLRTSEQALRGTHGQLRSVLDAATQVAIIATDLKGVITTFNAGAERMLGYPAAQVLGKLTLTTLHLPEELIARAAQLSAQHGRPIASAQAMLMGAIHEGDQQEGEWTLVRRDGSHVLVNMLATPLHDDKGQWAGHLAVCIDITERHRVHEALAERDRLLEKLSARVPGAIYQYREAPGELPHFSYCSAGIQAIFEVEPALLGLDAAPAYERIHAEDLERILASVDESRHGLTPWREEFRVQLPNKGLRWIRGEAVPELAPEGGMLWHGFFSDITDLKRVEQELRALSVTDSLTGIYNRRYFQERLKSELERAQRDKQDVAVIMLDIDHFKRINDQFGHAVGDRVLQAICQQVSQRLRRTDVFCRLGGEEFILLCPGVNGEQAYILATELWLALRSVSVKGVGVVTASFGVAGWRRGEGADALLLRADSGVYAAKQAGRDRVQPELL